MDLEECVGGVGACEYFFDLCADAFTGDFEAEGGLEVLVE